MQTIRVEHALEREALSMALGAAVNAYKDSARSLRAKARNQPASALEFRRLAKRYTAQAKTAAQMLARVDALRFP